MIWRECRGLMAYADQQMSTRRIVSIGIVALLHAALGYAFVTGLAYNVIKQVPTVLETFDVQEAKPPEEEPPPPPPEPEAAMRSPAPSPSPCLPRSSSPLRSAERRVGKACVRPCRSRRSPYH